MVASRADEEPGIDSRGTVRAGDGERNASSARNVVRSVDGIPFPRP